jgi:hypothetical protein
MPKDTSGFFSRGGVIFFAILVRLLFLPLLSYSSSPLFTCSTTRSPVWPKSPTRTLNVPSSSGIASTRCFVPVPTLSPSTSSTFRSSLLPSPPSTSSFTSWSAFSTRHRSSSSSSSSHSSSTSLCSSSSACSRRSTVLSRTLPCSPVSESSSSPSVRRQLSLFSLLLPPSHD